NRPGRACRCLRGRERYSAACIPRERRADREGGTWRTAGCSGAGDRLERAPHRAPHRIGSFCERRCLVLAPGVGTERALVGARGTFHLRTTGLLRSTGARDFSRAAASRSAWRQVRRSLWAAGGGFGGSAA